MDRDPVDLPLLCPRCGTALPPERRQLPWCECGWNLPPDTLEELRGARRLFERLNRALGRLQNRADAAWLRRRTGAVQRPFWHLHTALVVVLGLAIGLLPHALFACGVALALAGWRMNPCLGGPLFVAMAALAVWWNPLGLPAFRRRRTLVSYPALNLLEAAREAAEQVGAAPPDNLAFGVQPVLFVSARIRWSLPPRVERFVVVGLPVLAVLNISEFKAAVAEELVTASGARVWLHRYIWQAWGWFSQVVRPLTLLFIASAAATLFGAALPLLCPASLVLVAGPEVRPEYRTLWETAAGVIDVVRMLVLPAVLVAAVWVVAGLMLWLSARWHCRQVLIGSQAAARAFGARAVLRAQACRVALLRSFWSQVRAGRYLAHRPGARANAYTWYRDTWEGYPAAYRERILFSATRGSPALLQFTPLHGDLAAALNGIPDRPLNLDLVASLVPNIAEIGDEMAQP